MQQHGFLNMTVAAVGLGSQMQIELDHSAVHWNVVERPEVERGAEVETGVAVAVESEIEEGSAGIQNEDVHLIEMAERIAASASTAVGAVRGARFGDHCNVWRAKQVPT